MQALLETATKLLVYSLGRERSFLWLVTAGGVESFELPPRTAVEAAARRLHELWSGETGRAGVGGEAAPPGFGAGDRRAAATTAAELSAMLLGPVAARLDHQRLVVVPDGALSYVPFAALPLPTPPPPPPPSAPPAATPLPPPLLDRHEVVILPSASSLALERRLAAARPRPERWAEVLADPVFSAADPRVVAAGASPPSATAAEGDFARLPATRLEAEAIAALAPPGKVEVALDFAADREAVLGDRLMAYRIIHFATHGIADTDHPALSGLALSMVGSDARPREGFLNLRDIYNLRLDADLVVLSGCRTALGRELRGEGLIGLMRGFQYAGAARVVASLWRVDDRATELLMSRFYRALWLDGLPPAAALRRAQLALRAERPYRDPFFWAAFVLAGDWR
jgi:CHAT domain-containing protein